jgi:hypothetical protein
MTKDKTGFNQKPEKSLTKSYLIIPVVIAVIIIIALSLWLFFSLTQNVDLETGTYQIGK